MLKETIQLKKRGKEGKESAEEKEVRGVKGRMKRGKMKTEEVGRERKKYGGKEELNEKREY